MPGRVIYLGRSYLVCTLVRKYCRQTYCLWTKRYLLPAGEILTHHPMGSQSYSLPKCERTPVHPWHPLPRQGRIGSGKFALGGSGHCGAGVNTCCALNPPRWHTTHHSHPSSRSLNLLPEPGKLSGDNNRSIIWIPREPSVREHEGESFCSGCY